MTLVKTDFDWITFKERGYYMTVSSSGGEITNGGHISQKLNLTQGEREYVLDIHDGPRTLRKET